MSAGCKAVMVVRVWLLLLTHEVLDRLDCVHNARGILWCCSFRPLYRSSTCKFLSCNAIGCRRYDIGRFSKFGCTELLAFCSDDLCSLFSFGFQLAWPLLAAYCRATGYLSLQRCSLVCPICQWMLPTHLIF